MATTTKGIPYPNGSDPPNGPGQIQALADWLDAALTGTDQQTLTADPLQAKKIRFRWPRARTAASAPGGASRGELWCPTSGELEDVLHMHDGTNWVRVPPDLSDIIADIASLGADLDDLSDASPRGVVALETFNGLQTSITSETDVDDLSATFTGVAGRAYVVRVQASLRAADDQLRAGGYICRADNSRISTWAHWHSPPPSTGSTFTTALCSGESFPIGFTGSTTVKARIERLLGPGTLTVVGNIDGGAYIAVHDVGLLLP